MKLTVVMPVYNEEKSIELVIKEWNQALQSEIPDQFRFLVIDDGATDGTPEILNRLEGELNNLIHYRKENSGHGDSCLVGYKKAIELTTDWVLQIDSDYQCDPIYFKEFWAAAQDSKVIMGKRIKRLDGFYRLILTKIISLWLFFFTGRFCPDPNVPYRLIEASYLSRLIRTCPSLHLTNSFLSYRMMQNRPIHWIKIHFRNRLYGQSFHKFVPTLKAIFKLTRALLFHKLGKKEPVP
jgi:dolichol-phosphate mannosyltransferase